MRAAARITAILLAFAVMTLVPLSLLAPAASAASAQPARTLTAAQSAHVAAAALDWAETQDGKPYVYGAAGPYAYDCSGLVQAAYTRAGVRLPRDTYEMLGSPLLQRIPASQAVRGDLVFFGDGHVEMFTVWKDMTFGALNAAAGIGWHRWYPGSGWEPTAYYRVI